jgi:hypoxanthine phosphoribosyltransferase
MSKKIHPLEDYGQVAAHVSEILYTAEEIEQRVWELGQTISNDYQAAVSRGEPLLLVGLLKGVVIFMADLLRAITIPVEVDFMDIDHYSLESQSGGVLDLERHLDYPIEHSHVLFVEDIIDKGLTLNHLLRNLRVRRPVSLKVCTMFDKPARRLIDIPIDYTGFELPDCFVVGYGLDYEQKYRNLPFVGLLDYKGLKKTQAAVVQ